MRSVFFLLLIFLVASQAIICYLRPYYNWDMLAYMACVVSVEEKNEDVIHALVYQAAESELPPENFRSLTELNQYRRMNFSNAGYFYSQLKLYWVKPLYVILIFLLYKTGIPLTVSALLPSLIGILGLGALLFSWIKRYVKPLMAFVVSSLLMLSPPIWDAARYATPDAFAALFVFAGFYFLLEKKNVWYGMSFLLVAILVRVDLALLFFMMLAFLWLRKNFIPSFSKVRFSVFTIAGITAVTLISVLTGNLFDNLSANYSFSESGDPVTESYWRRVAEFFPQLRYSHLSLFISITVIAFLLRSRNEKPLTQSGFAFGIFLLSYILVRFLIFPSLEDRFFIAMMLTLPVIALKALGEPEKYHAEKI